jgi:filamentous hemagglutinin family protein
MNKPLLAREEFRWSIRKKGKHVFNVCTQFAALHVLAFAMMAGTSTIAFANPTGGTVTAGSATITGTGTSEVDITQTTNRAIIDWKGFDISNGETTKFIQPGTTSLTLNRVTTSGQITSIDGNLQANGHVLIINPNGVLIGPHGNVDVAGFVASSANVDDASFMSGTSVLQFDKAGNANASICSSRRR